MKLADPWFGFACVEDVSLVFQCTKKVYFNKCQAFSEYNIY
jgi:hypothetical protein